MGRKAGMLSLSASLAKFNKPAAKGLVVFCLAAGTSTTPTRSQGAFNKAAKCLAEKALVELPKYTTRTTICYDQRLAPSGNVIALNAAARSSRGCSTAMRSIAEPSWTPWQSVWVTMY